MSSIIATYLQDVIFQASENFRSGFENRLSNYGAIDAVVKDSARGLLPTSFIESTKTALTQPTKAPVLKKFTATSTPNDSCTPSGETSESAFVGLTWQKLGFTIKHIPAQYADNYIAAQQQMAHDMLQGFKMVYAALDTAALAFLEANKTAQAPTSAYFTATGGAWNHTGDPSKVYAYVPSFLNLMDLEGPYVSVADTEHKSDLLLTSTLGVQNSQNLAGLTNGNLAYAGNFDYNFTNRMNKGANRNKFYVFPQGTTSIVNWTHPQYRGGSGLRIDESNYWFTASDPLYGMNWEAHYVSSCADLSATSRSLPPATKVETIWFGLNFAFARQYSSTTDTPIVSFTLNEPTP